MAEASNQGTRRKLAPRSGVWVHFSRFKDSDGNDKAQCNRCRLVLGASTRNGTSSLWAHVRICWGDDEAAASAAAAAAAAAEQAPRLQATSGDRNDGSDGDLARMIALHGYDPSFLEDDYFRSFVRRLNPEYEVPSRDAIEEMCDGIFDEARKDFFSRIRRAPGKVSLGVGKAKTIKEGEVIYIVCHFIDDQWKLQKMVVDALVPAGTHYTADGPILGLDVVTDAAGFVSYLIPKHKDRLFMVAYDCSSINYEVDCSSINYVDNVLHSVARCLVPDLDFTIGMSEDVMSLNLTRQERLQLLSELELDLDSEWAYNEPWCACYSSLEVLRKKGELVRPDLLVDLLCKVWEQAYRGIQRTSASRFPTSNLCLAELFKLREILQPELARFSGDIADDESEYGYDVYENKRTVDVLRLASDTIDKAIQDSYLVWSVPLALDPRYKLNHIVSSFRGAFGSEAEKYISEVKTEINGMYDLYIMEYGTADADHSDIANATTSADPLEQAWNEHCREVMAARVNNNCYPETQTELDRYLQDRLAPTTEDFDLLKWWKDHSSEYPMVARMARDALAIPTCSKLASDQLASVRSILRGYSKKSFGNENISWLSWFSTK